LFYQVLLETFPQDLATKKNHSTTFPSSIVQQNTGKAFFSIFYSSSQACLVNNLSSMRCRSCSSGNFSNPNNTSDLSGFLPPSGDPFALPLDSFYSPSPAPYSSSANNMSSSDTARTMDILATVFFVVAGLWLIIAMLYSLMVLLFLRLRARGQLDRIYENDFGRVYLGSTSLYIPCGFILRRYLQHLQFEHTGGQQRGANGETPRHPRYMTREERRAAMEVLLSQNPSVVTPNAKYDVTEGCDDSSNRKEDGYDTDGPTCSICLAEYEPEDDVLRSQTCPHEFHRECVLDWLQRPSCTECPCCRAAMVKEDVVWETVRAARKRRRRELRKQTGTRSSILKEVRSRTSEENLEATEEESESAGNPERREAGVVTIRFGESVDDLLQESEPEDPEASDVLDGTV
jgi:hypothetical protein